MNDKKPLTPKSMPPTSDKHNNNNNNNKRPLTPKNITVLDIVKYSISVVSRVHASKDYVLSLCLVIHAPTLVILVKLSACGLDSSRFRTTKL